MVSGTACNDTVLYGITKRREFAHRTANFERPCSLQVLSLEHHVSAVPFG
jgi:hypothetical protein